MTPRGTVDTDAVHRAAAALGPRAFAELLGRRPVPRGRRDEALVACFVHKDDNPSCTVVVRAGRVVWRCHSCTQGGDIFSAAAGVWGYDVRRSFPEVARRVADLLGVQATADAPAPRRRPRLPVADLAVRIDAAAERVVLGLGIYDADHAAIAAAPFETVLDALALLARADRRVAALDAQRSDELDRLADLHEERERRALAHDPEAA